VGSELTPARGPGTPVQPTPRPGPGAPGTPGPETPDLMRRDVERARERLQFLAEAGEALVSSLDSWATLDRVATLIVGRIADGCSIEMVDEEGVIRNVAVAHREQAKWEQLTRIRRRYPVSLEAPSGLGKVLRTGEPELYPDIDEGSLHAGIDDPDHAQDMLALGVRSVMEVPLVARGRTLGAITLIGTSPDWRFTEEDVPFVSSLAHRAALAIDNARLFEAEQDARRVAERAAARTRVMQDVTAALARALTPAEVAEVVLHRGVPAVGAHSGVVALLNDQGDELQILSSVGYREGSMRAWRRFPLAAAVPLAEAVRTGLPVMATSMAEVAERYPPLRGSLVPVDHALACIPLAVEGRSIGGMSISFGEERAVGPEDVELMTALANQCAQAMERARLYETERRIAETLQRSLLPQRLPAVDGLMLQARYLPAGRGEQVGGDWFDAIPLPDGRVGLAVGDVAGHGVRAASVMGQLRHALRAYAFEGASPARVLDRLDRLVKASGDELMATAVYGVLSPATGELVYALAGHPPPLLVGPQLDVRYLDEGRSVPLGAVDRSVFGEATARCEPGCTLLLYTDGIVDRRRVPMQESLARLERAATERLDLDGLCDRILGEVFDGEDPEDDVALLAVRLAPAEPGPVRMRLPAEPSVLAALRRRLGSFLSEVGANDVERYEVLVCASEAGANAIEHAYGLQEAAFELEATYRDGQVEVVVRDFGSWREGRRPDRGRGLVLIREFMDSVDVVRGSDGTTVRMRRALGTST
jgi:serine phosphatase RsbU (regulator of sigma subunit)/anti-sigma regulatory factor (Ser/Thr protein kinase)